MWTKVDFPDPDGPMIALNLPRSKPVLTPTRASTAAWPSPKRRLTSVAVTTCPSGGAMRSRYRERALLSVT
jgi:hypothetical protein